MKVQVWAGKYHLNMQKACEKFSIWKPTWMFSPRISVILFGLGLDVVNFEFGGAILDLLFVVR